ncbi:MULTISPECIES: carbohydrate ABC transporter permease [Paenibacillus]|uniref:carbohydrate ABC transporter permease n=1 Tax=Paenibacillus TaxID=44249 RepID=UPI000954E050|nr:MULTISPECIES: carbohydrate ABC transporter permease [Paenibacillus]ASS67064.1 carbohydrate ABC transporter permease [Paenibacillus sp. RUD330]SIQ91236.1 multiple sugar transport system permease protein [Paenibacillus sp. RU4X]SIR12140.1 multiple sugar transport system permease protein [Paenibacillus sp. RU4T]
MSPSATAGLQAQPASRAGRREQLWSKAVSLILLLLVTAAMLSPLAFMVSTSLKTSKELLIYPPQLLPDAPAWGNYAELFRNGEIKFGQQYMNSLIVAVSAVVGTVLSSALVAFGFARYRTKASGFLFLLVLSTMMLPYPAIMIPQFLLFTKLGLHDSLLPLILPNFFGSAYMIFLLKQFFSTMPSELYEAGRIDGCSEFRLFWNLTLPLAGPAMATVAIFTFIGSWNDLLTPVLYLDSQENFTLPIGLASMMSSKFRLAPWNLLMAASMLTAVPIILLFAVAQRRFVEGIVLTGIK